MSGSVTVKWQFLSFLFSFGAFPMIFPPEAAPKEVVSHRGTLRKSHCAREGYLASLYILIFYFYFSMHNGPKPDESCGLNLWHDSVLFGKSVQRVDSFDRLLLAHFCAEGNFLTINFTWQVVESLDGLINCVKWFLEFLHPRQNATWPLRDPANIQVTNVVLLSHSTLCLLNLKYGEDPFFGRQILNHIERDLGNLRECYFRCYLSGKVTSFWKGQNCRGKVTLPTPKPGLIAENCSHKFQELTEILPLGLMVPSLYKASRDDFLRHPTVRDFSSKEQRGICSSFGFGRSGCLGHKGQIQGWGRKRDSASPAHLEGSSGSGGDVWEDPIYRNFNISPCTRSKVRPELSPSFTRSANWAPAHVIPGAEWKNVDGDSREKKIWMAFGGGGPNSVLFSLWFNNNSIWVKAFLRVLVNLDWFWCLTSLPWTIWFSMHFFHVRCLLHLMFLPKFPLQRAINLSAASSSI